MNAKQFFDLVANMRAKQKQHFNTCDRRVLAASKALEHAVDAEIARVNKLTQPNLFD